MYTEIVKLINLKDESNVSFSWREGDFASNFTGYTAIYYNILVYFTGSGYEFHIVFVFAESIYFFLHCITTYIYEYSHFCQCQQANAFPFRISQIFLYRNICTYFTNVKKDFFLQATALTAHSELLSTACIHIKYYAYAMSTNRRPFIAAHSGNHHNHKSQCNQQ